MENASKALLIAAGVLIVILLVTFGIKIFSSSGDSAKQVQDVGDSISVAGKDATDKVGSILDRLGGSSVSLNHSGVIPSGGEYISGGIKYEPGDTMPTLKNGDTYTYRDYKYTYHSTYNYWYMSVLDKTKSKYGEILHNINGKEIGSISFNGCENLTNSPDIPQNVQNISGAYMWCKKLEEMPEIPENVWQMNHTFYGCEAMATFEDIPDSVKTMAFCFYNCLSITSVTIPRNVINVTQAFEGCDSLTSITIKKSAGSLNLNSPPSGLKPAQISSVIWAP